LNHWVVKKKPTAFSWDDLMALPDATVTWAGVRNYQAHNYMRDTMRPGEPALFYHSQTKTPAVVGVAEVASPGRPDPTQFDPSHRRYDPAASFEKPRWYAVGIRAVRRLERPVTLRELRGEPELESLELLRRGSMLTVHPIAAAAFLRILQLAAVNPAE